MVKNVVFESAGGLRRELLEVVVAKGYTRSAEPFVLSSGGLSHDYVDMRRAVAGGADLGLAARAVIATLDEAGVVYDAIGGMTMGADPVAHAVAMLGGCSWYSVRKAEKDHGSRNRVEGVPLSSAVRVVVFEDTISTGKSVLDALEVVQDSGANVVGACTLLDRGEVAAASFERLGIAYFPLLSYRDLGIDPLGGPGPTETGGAPAR